MVFPARAFRPPSPRRIMASMCDITSKDNTRKDFTMPQPSDFYVLRTDGDPAKRAFYRAFRDFNPLNDLEIG